MSGGKIAHHEHAPRYPDPTILTPPDEPFRHEPGPATKRLDPRSR